jgi:argininosuccinate synthase
MAKKKNGKSMKVVLAYSGGLDTTVAIRWLQENYDAEVIAVCVDVGQAENMDGHVKRAQENGAKAYLIDARQEFVNDYIIPALKANVLYEGIYPAGTALARHLICEKIVAIAKAEGATYLAHGCTAKGNDQVRFESSFAVLAPDIKVIAPMREWPVSREEEIEWAKSKGITVPVKATSPYSTDQNLWGRSVECGVLEDPWVEPPSDAFECTASLRTAPDEPENIIIAFEKGVPVSLNGKKMEPMELIIKLNSLAGAHGIGRIDHIENRIVGIKSREIYEYPAATVLIKAHQALEKHVHAKDLANFKALVDQKVGDMVYGGLWFTPLMKALLAFEETTQEVVTGEITLKFYKGSATVVGSRSPLSLYNMDLSTYGASDGFNHAAAAGFLELYTLPLKGQSHQKAQLEGTNGISTEMMGQLKINGKTQAH